MSRISYSRNEIISKLEQINSTQEIYNSDVINYRGNTKDTKEKYTEIVAQEILRNPEKYDFLSVNKINRERTYNVGHDGIYNDNSTRKEEVIAMKMYKRNYDVMGKILDYQVPLKDAQDTKAGKIDLISFKEEEQFMYLIELKNNVSKETLLRCVLEIITYYSQVDREKLKQDFGVSKEVEVKPAILVFKNTRPYEDLNDKYVNKLIEKFGIDVFVAKQEHDIEKISK